MPPNPKWSIGSTVADKFRVRAHLGQGGMGSVLEVEHQFTKYVGALKIINEEYASHPTIVQRFLREASAAGRIGSPYIVEMFDAGMTADGLPYLFMELLKGRSLEQWIATDGQLSVRVALEVCIQAANGLLAAHDAGSFTATSNRPICSCCQPRRAFGSRCWILASPSLICPSPIQP